MQAVFLDRDGVINENRTDHVKTWEEFRFLPDAPEAIAHLSRAGIKVFVITNQAVINRGMVSREAVDAINQKMMDEIAKRGGRIEAVAYCPHRPDEECACRKPQPGLLVQIARHYGVDLVDSVLIGDALTDMDAGQSVGCRTILVRTGRGEEQMKTALRAGKNGFTVAPDLLAAAHLVLSPAFATSPHGASVVPVESYAVA